MAELLISEHKVDMKTKILFQVCCFSLLVFYTSAVWALDWAVGVEIPISYTFTSADDGSALEPEGTPSGFLLSGQLDVLPVGSLGAILDSYTISLKDNGDSTVSRTLVGLYYLAPIPFIELAIGAGYGYSSVQGQYADKYDQGTATQYLIKLGYNIIGNIGIHGSYRIIQSKIKYENTDFLLETGGTMISLGASFGF